MKQGKSIYYMRCWLRQLRHSRLCHHILCPSPWCILEALIVISTLYICNQYEGIICSTWVNWVIEQCELSKDRAPTIWGADWDYFGTANHIVIILYPSSCCIQEALIVTFTMLITWFIFPMVINRRLLLEHIIDYLSSL